MKNIILDTNTLIAISEFKIDIFSELRKACDFRYTVNIVRGTIDELEKIVKEQRGKYKLAAKLALSLLNAKEVNILPETGYVDNILVDYSKKGYLILTQDIGLKKRLTKPYLTIRQKKKIIVVK
jgi:uncharacterized protein